MTPEEARTILEGTESTIPWKRLAACEVLVNERMPEAVPALLKFLPSASQVYFFAGGLGSLLEKACTIFPESTPELCAAATAAVNQELISAGIELWVQSGITGEEDAQLFRKSMQGVLALETLLISPTGDNRGLVEVLVAKHAAPLLRYCEEDLWGMLDREPPLFPHAAARVLAALGNQALPRVEQLCSHERPVVRSSAVVLLRTLGTSEALHLLRRRLHEEDDDDVRDRILETLVEREGSLPLTEEQLLARMDRALAKYPTSPVPWLDATKLCVMRKDGRAFTTKEVHYLLHRQSRVTESRADHEAAPLFADVDRSAGTETALLAIRGFIKSKQKVVDRWTITFAGLTGDDRIVAELLPVIDRFVELHRNHHATCATLALALQGSDRALLALDAISFRYRSKKPQVALAAGEAFTEAAVARGITPEELGDVVVPWLGFSPEGPRIATGAKQSYEVRITSDLKLSFRDVKTGKISASAPAGLSAEGKAEFKELAKTLKDVGKIQTDRLEALMVKQVRWPVPHWQALYPVHPLLRPLGARLIWGQYGGDGSVGKTFRMLEDGSLTDVKDEPVTLDEGKRVGIVHPLDLDEVRRAAWLQHVVDYEVQPLFPQMDRTIVRLDPASSAAKSGAQVRGAEMNALTFQGRAMRLGWRRASIVDAGMVNYYQKNMPSAGLDCFLELEGLFIRADREQTATLGDFFFVKQGSLGTGYIMVSQEQMKTDPRIVPFGEVPEIVYSEILGDLGRIAGAGVGAGE
ncbi:HEAT repeat protein [Roseimicrobium gellanilyticum]|uniref:HEAT repeat protein n=1 Tax=Roseimicrobium gellanilyticum TaxID=748857 RepID=A0A366HS76_9BACT|nr:DUF4132 domain-containing protein [Roseimicrobium gellanilyticum]RBP45774.1 HEAT repeat protein [Roseimicrobium gellanilyticum]